MIHTNQIDSYDALIKAGAAEKLAREIVKMVEDGRTDGLENFATKKDIENMELRLELKINTLDGKIDKLHERFEGKIDKLQWMIGFIGTTSITLSIAILVKLFLN
jgi:hypothetical protein